MEIDEETLQEQVLTVENPAEKVLSQLTQTLNNRDIKYIELSKSVTRALQSYDKVEYMNPVILASAIIYYRVTRNTAPSINPAQILSHEVENVMKSLGPGTAIDAGSLQTKIAVNILAYVNVITPYIQNI